MKFLSQTQKIHNLPQTICQSYNFNLSEDQNSKKEIQNLNFTPEVHSQINELKIAIGDSNFIHQKPRIEDLVKTISKLSKTQINIASRLFLQLGYQLSLQPQKISQIKVEKSFIVNLIEFTKNLKQKDDNQEENQMKVYKNFLNSLLYILMLLLCGHKENQGNNELKEKIFGNKSFLKNFLGIQIYKHRKISKLYGIIIVHIYKQNPSLDVKKCLVQSIIKNMKNLNHQKTQLNLSMILNELKFSYKLKQIVVNKQNLINKIQDIFFNNQQTFQSVYTLNYLLHLVFEFPNISKKSDSQYKRKLEITENIKNYVLSSRFFERNYLRFFQWHLQQLGQDQKIILTNQLLSNLRQTIESHSQKQNDKIGSEKWIYFLLELFQILIKSSSNEQTMFSMTENIFFDTLFQLLKKNFLDDTVRNKIQEIFKQYLNKVKTLSRAMYQPLLNLLSVNLLQIQSSINEDHTRRQKIIQHSKKQNGQKYGFMMELQ